MRAFRLSVAQVGVALSAACRSNESKLVTRTTARALHATDSAHDVSFGIVKCFELQNVEATFDSPIWNFTQENCWFPKSALQVYSSEWRIWVHPTWLLWKKTHFSRHDSVFKINTWSASLGCTGVALQRRAWKNIDAWEAPARLLHILTWCNQGDKPEYQQQLIHLRE